MSALLEGSGYAMASKLLGRWGEWSYLMQRGEGRAHVTVVTPGAAVEAAFDPQHPPAGRRVVSHSVVPHDWKHREEGRATRSSFSARGTRRAIRHVPAPNAQLKTLNSLKRLDTLGDRPEIVGPRAPTPKHKKKKIRFSRKLSESTSPTFAPVHAQAAAEVPHTPRI